MKICKGLVAFGSRRKSFTRFYTREAKANGPMPCNSPEISAPAAATIVLPGVDRDHHVAALPRALSVGKAPEADAVADGPYPHQPVQLAADCGYSGGDCVGVVEDPHGQVDSPIPQTAADLL